MAGDAADDAFDAAMNEWLDRDFDEEHDPDYDDWLRGGRRGLMPRRCRYCNAKPLFWSKVKREDGSEGWRLANAAGELHTCEEYREAKAQEAEELEARAFDTDIPF